MSFYYWWRRRRLFLQHKLNVHLNVCRTKVNKIKWSFGASRSTNIKKRIASQIKLDSIFNKYVQLDGVLSRVLKFKNSPSSILTQSRCHSYIFGLLCEHKFSDSTFATTLTMTFNIYINIVSMFFYPWHYVRYLWASVPFWFESSNFDDEDTDGLHILTIKSFEFKFEFVLKNIPMWAYNLMVNSIVRTKYIFVENDKIEILFSNCMFWLTFQSPTSK